MSTGFMAGSRGDGGCGGGMLRHYNNNDGGPRRRRAQIPDDNNVRKTTDDDDECKDMSATAKSSETIVLNGARINTTARRRVHNHR